MLSNLISSQYPLRNMFGGVNETRRNVISEQFQIENMQNMGYPGSSFWRYIFGSRLRFW